VRKLVALAVAGAVALAAGCGGDDGGGKAGARQAVQRYFAALGDKDATGACQTFTESSQEKLAEFGHDHLKTGASCREVVDLLLQAPAGTGLAKLRGARITAVELKGAEQAEVRVQGLDRPIDLRLQGGRWRIASQPAGETD
jgi:hypothetical protein